MATIPNASTRKDRLVYTLEAQVTESETSSFEVGEQRERNHRFYSMEPFGNEVKGRSQYVSPDVMDAVEGKKALFSESFLGARDIIRFSNCPTPGEAEAKTAYVKKVFAKNKIARLFRDGWHDAMVAKRLTVLVEWFDEEEEQTAQLQGAMAQAVEQQLQQMPGIRSVDSSQVQAQMMPTVQGPQHVLTGPLVIKVDGGYVKLSLVQPERYMRDPNAAYPDGAQWNTIQEDVARGVLIDQGFDREQVEGLSSEYRFRSEEEDAARKRHDSSWSTHRQTNRVESQEEVSYFRTWTYLDVDEDTFTDFNLGDTPPEPGYGLYEIHWSAGEVLMWADGTHAIKPVESCGIFEWTEMKISHAENGMCTSDVMAYVQKNQSGLKRLVFDNQQMANSSRNLLLKNSLKNPRDLLDNKIGATLLATRTDAVTPLPVNPLSPLTMEAIRMGKADGEERSGISGLAKGMNTDAVKYQNADNMIDRLTTAGQRRVTAEARDFAATFLVPVSQYIIQLAMEFDQGQDQMEVGGEMRPIVPSQWQDDALDMETETAITPEEAQRLAQQMLMMHNMFIQDPTMGPMYGPEQKHATLDRIYELIGVSDTSQILLAPSDPRYAQAMQQQAATQAQEQQVQQRITGVQVDATVAQTEAIRSSEQRQWSEVNWKKTNDMADNLLDERKQDWTEDKDQQELDIERSQPSG